MTRYFMTYDFTETAEQAQAIIDAYHKTATPYARKHHKGLYTPWEALDGKSNMHYVAITYYKR